MACPVNPDPLDLLKLLPPLAVAGFVATALTRRLLSHMFVFTLFWYVGTYLAFFFEDAVDGHTAFFAYSVSFYAIGSAVATTLTLVGRFPRLFEFLDVIRGTYDREGYFADRRFFVWEGLVVVVSAFALYIGTLFVIGAYSDGCILLDQSLATTLGWIFIAVGIVGVLVVILVTIFSRGLEYYARLKMWKYAISAILLIGGHVLVNDLTYALGGSDVFYGLFGLIPLAVFWPIVYVWIRFVPFYDEISVRNAAKSMGDDVAGMIVKRDVLDGFGTVARLNEWLITGALYTFVHALVCWLVAAFLPGITAAGLTLTAGIVAAVTIALILILWATNTLYARGASARKSEPYTELEVVDTTVGRRAVGAGNNYSAHPKADSAFY